MDQIIALSVTKDSHHPQQQQQQGDAKRENKQRKNSNGDIHLTLKPPNNGVYTSISSGFPIWIPFLVAIIWSCPVSSYSYNLGSPRSNWWNHEGSRIMGVSARRNLSFGNKAITTTAATTTRLNSLVDENSFETASSKKKQLITTKKGKEATVEFKDFWGSSIASIEKEERPPYVPTLDPFWGSLPKAAYQCEADERWDPKLTCSIAVDLTCVMKQDYCIPMVQHYLESGFQTFHVGPNPQFIREFHAQTPTKLIGKDAVHWVLSYRVPTKVESLQSIRQDVLDNLLDPMSSCSTDAIDTLVVQYNPKSPYHMDVLYVLNELQEEGFIRSIGLEHFPPNLVAKAVVECGFSVSLVQQPGSLLLPPEEVMSSIPYQWTTDPFLNGLLLLDETDNATKRSKNKKGSNKQTTSIHAGSPKQQKQWDSTLEQWAKRHGVTSRDEDGKEFIDPTHVAETLERQVLNVLQEMSWRYGVPLKSLILRWAMEFNGNNSSVIIPAPTGDVWKDTEDFASSSLWRAHIQELRQAFTFRIEEDDKALLAEMSKKTEQDEGMPMMDLGELEEFLVQQGLPEKEIEALLMEQERQQQQRSPSSSSTTDYPKIEFDNPKLWL